VSDFEGYYTQQRTPELSPDLFDNAGELWQRSSVRVAISKHVISRTDQCLDTTRRALESSIAILNRGLPSLIRSPHSRAAGSQDFVRALPVMALSLVCDDDGDLEKYSRA
jgi:hypothetical protein